MDTTIPDKLYFKIGEVAKLVGVPPHVLRYWEGEFPGIDPKRAKSGQRLFRRADLLLLLRIRSLLHDEGYTIAGARRLVCPHATLPARGTANGWEECSTAEKVRRLKGELQEIQRLCADKKDE